MPADFDASDFLKRLDLANRLVQRGLGRGMAVVLGQGERIMKQNCPIDQSGKKPGGTLNASCRGDPKTITVSAEKIQGLLTAGGGEASDYAWAQHEGEFTHSYPVSGTYAAKYVEKAVAALVPIAPAVLAKHAKDALDSGGSQ